MANKFNLKADYTCVLNKLQVEIDSCKERLNLYAKHSTARREVIEEREKHIEILDLVMKLLLNLKGSITLDLLDKLDVFIKQIRKEPEISEGNLVLKKYKGGNIKRNPYYLIIHL